MSGGDLNDAKGFLGRGWAFPVQTDEAGDVALAEYEEDIRQAILIILQTNPGERVMRPDFGAGLHQVVFAPINQSTVALVRHRVEHSLVLWEPRIDQVSVRIEAAPKRGLLSIDVRYRVRRTNTFYNLVYPFEVREAEV